MGLDESKDHLLQPIHLQVKALVSWGLAQGHTAVWRTALHNVGGLPQQDHGFQVTKALAFVGHCPSALRQGEKETIIQGAHHATPQRKEGISWQRLVLDRDWQYLMCAQDSRPLRRGKSQT